MRSWVHCLFLTNHFIGTATLSAILAHPLGGPIPNLLCYPIVVPAAAVPVQPSAVHPLSFPSQLIWRGGLGLQRPQAPAGRHPAAGG